MKRALLCCFLWLTTLSLWAQYDPSNPPEPGAYYTLTLQATPVEGGSFNINTTTSQVGGNFVRLRASASSNFQFVAWAENGVIVSQDAQFDYQMPARNVTLTAHFDYTPSDPSEPSTPDIPVYSRVYVSCDPSEGGSVSGVTSGTRYTQGTSLSVRASSNSDFQFDYWTEEGEVISTSASFKYLVKTFDTHLVAHFSYNPSNPSEPPIVQPLHKLYISVSPAGAGTFTPSSGSTYQFGKAVSLRATANSGYTFSHWSENDSVISTKASTTYTMPDRNAALQAHFVASDYNPTNPAEPGAPTGERHNIFGMTENALRGETIMYPVWLENSTQVMNMYIDLTFPDGFEVDTAGAHLSGRAGNHWLEKIWIEGNTWRMRIRGNDVLSEKNGPVMEIPVTIPEDAHMAQNYLVALTHGVVMRPDSTQVPIGVRSGYIYVRKLFEDELFASFSFDKYQTRVGFKNRSSGHIQSIEWDFGDGQRSTVYNPLHVYSEPGTYTVRLTIQGESEQDIMETSIFLNDANTWKAEGSFSIDTSLVSARNFTSLDELINTLLQAEVTGNIVVNILHDLNLNYSLNTTGITNLITLYNKVKQSGHTITFRQSGQGGAPVLTLGVASQHSLNAMQQLWETLDAVTWQNIETHLYGIWFDFAEWKALQHQIVSLGDKTQPIDFTRIAPSLSYAWLQMPKSDVIFGALEQGTGTLPSMLLSNEGEGANDVLFAVSASRNGQPFCNFTHTITVAPALVGLFNDLTPADHALLDVTAFTISWNRILNAQFDLYLWDSINSPSVQPVLANADVLQYATSGFCRFGHSYKWVVVASNGAQRVVSDTMSFSIRALPNLHVTSVHCTDAEAEGKLTVNWSVRNDGQGHTGSQQWTDRVWLVMDVYTGTAMTEFKPALLAETDNVKALDTGESYSRSLEVTLPKEMYGDLYIVVTSDMYNLQDIEWNSVGGAVPNPYQPTTTGSGYRYLYARTSAQYNNVYEEDETPTHSDNFFYTKLQLAMPPVPDLQITEVEAEPLALSEYVYNDGTVDLYAEYRPTPLTHSRMAYNKEWFSGKQFKVTATIVNRGTAPITKQSWRNGLWMANSADRNNSELTLLATRSISSKTLAPNESVSVTFYAELPYGWQGNTVFHVMADVDDAVNEFANTPNNWWQTDTIVVQRTPGADFRPQNLQVPNRLVAGQDFELKYNVQNIGAGVPYVNHWTDKVWLSSSAEGLDDNATCIASIHQGGRFNKTVANAPSGYLPRADEYGYEGDNYSVSQTINVGNIPSGKYYVYVQVDAENKVDETEIGESNNIIRSDSVRFAEPDLEIESFSVSRDTVTTGEQVALTWKVRNVGAVDILNARTTDNLYATINQDGSNPRKLIELTNDISIPVGGEKTLRANITIPKSEELTGIQYLYLNVNHNKKIKESNTANNRSALVKTYCIYTEEEQIPPVAGPAIAVSDVNAPAELFVDYTATIIFRIKNIGDKRIEQDITKELYLSPRYSTNAQERVVLQNISVEGTTAELRPEAFVMVTIRFRVPADMLGGQYYLQIRCDKGNVIHSKNTNKNNESAQVFVHGQLPDPIMMDVSISDTLWTEQPDTLRFAWKNIGTWRNNKFRTQIYLSKSQIFKYTDKSNVLLTTLSCAALDPNETKTYEYPINLEDKNAGKWYVHVIPEWDERTFLTDSAKTYSKGVVVELSQVPDLILSDVQTEPSCLAGEPIRISFTVQNNSDVNTRQSRWADDFWLSPSAKLDTKNATKLGSRTHSGVLEANQSYEASVSYPVPETMHGNYMLYVRTDAADAIVESDEDNDFKAIPVYIRDANDRPADLVITNLSVPDVIYAGESVSISYTITNQGEFDADGNLRDILYLSNDNQWDTGDNLVGVVSGNIHLAPGEQITRTATGVITSAISGAYYPILRTNSTRAVAENDYENNVFASSPLQLDFRTLEIGNEKEVNTTAFLRMTVQDNQSVVVRLTHPMGKNVGLYVSSGDVPSTARNEWHSAKLQTNRQEVVLSNLKAGNYYVLAQDNDAVMSVDDYSFSLSGYNRPQGAGMTIKAEIVDFGATSLELTQGGNGGWVTTDINGALFDSIMDFRLTRGNHILPAEVVTWDGGTQAAVTFNLTEAEEGTYHLVSERPDGLNGTLENAFEVVEGRAFDLGISLDFPSRIRAGVSFPFSFSYANGGTTDVELSEIRIVMDNGIIGLSVEDLQNNPQSTIAYKPHGETNARGYVSIPPGEQKIVNAYCTPQASTITVTLFIFK